MACDRVCRARSVVGVTDYAYAFVDVFAARPFSGNPVTVVPDADDLDLATMQAIAREFNQSETTFLLRPDIEGADHQLRSFTPVGAEVGGAGHNALGAWIWLARAGRLPGGRSQFAQQIGRNLLPVTVNSDSDGVEVSMVQSPPVTGDTVADRDELAASLTLRPADLAPSPALVISTGAGHLLVEVNDRAAVDRSTPDSPRLKAALQAVGGEGCYVYTREGSTDAYARFFNPTVGIMEDPATGTAAGPLATRLVSDGILPDGATAVIEQGAALGRPSLIRVTVRGTHVRISGRGLISADGTLYV